jgi:hypothetical protein
VPLLPLLPDTAPAPAAAAAASDVVEELKEKGVAEVSDGATCVFVEGSEVPLIVQKSDGGYGYASTDMAAIKQRINQEKADWVIYVTDIGQAPHFDMVFAAARKAGWLPEKGSAQVGGADRQAVAVLASQQRSAGLPHIEELQVCLACDMCVASCCLVPLGSQQQKLSAIPSLRVLAALGVRLAQLPTVVPRGSATGADVPLTCCCCCCSRRV